MYLRIEEFEDQQSIPGDLAFGVVDADTHVRLSANRNPTLEWGELPPDTRSLVLLCVDVDVPTKADDVNQEDREVPPDLLRADFYHWVMVDIPPTVSAIAGSSCSDGVTPGGKQQPTGPDGSRQGINDYTIWFAGDEEMAGNYFGYDGPCPPWNDSLIHHYHFVLYATDLERCAVDGEFTGRDVGKALQDHMLGEARVIGRYTLNPRLAGQANSA
jgi:hypothetical protein